MYVTYLLSQSSHFFLKLLALTAKLFILLYFFSISDKEYNMKGDKYSELLDRHYSV